MLTKEKTIIISLGGSLIYTKEGVNIPFLKKFEKFIRKQVSLGKRFFIVTGGGYVARKYQKAAKETVGEITPGDVDWLGIHATRINAHLLRTIFADIAHPKIIDQYKNKEISKAKVTIGAGWKPGWSTDYDAVILARDNAAKTIINLSDIRVVYDKDPKIYSDAAPIETTNWEYYRSLISEKWEPGLSAPFDPIASKMAQELGLTVIIVKGDNLKNLENLFAGRKFKGTVITSLRPDGSFFNKKHFETGKSEDRGYTTNPLIQLRQTIRDVYRALKIKIFLRPKSLLDVGCGTGKMVKYLRIMGVDAQGVEVSEYLISKLNSNLENFVKKGSILNLPYNDSSFDLVTTYDVLEHIPTDILGKAVFECNRVSKNLVLHKIYTIENWWIEYTHELDISHVSVFSKEWWEKFFKEKGFKKAKIFFPRLPSFMESLFILEKR